MKSDRIFKYPFMIRIWTRDELEIQSLKLLITQMESGYTGMTLENASNLRTGT